MQRNVKISLLKPLRIGMFEVISKCDDVIYFLCSTVTKFLFYSVI